MIRRTIVLLFCLLAAGCSGAQVLNAVSFGAGVEVERGIAYGDDARQKYDVYRPKDVPDAPVIVFFYGGGWDSGKRSSYAFLGNALAAEGYTVAIPDYRVYPKAIFPAFVEDGAEALAAIRGDVARGQPVILMGHSAGAHIAALLALDPRYLRAEGLSPCGTISTFVGLSGPYDFLPIEDVPYTEIFPKELRTRSQPINFAAGRHPPSLLLHGLSDSTVDPDNTRHLASALRSAGDSVTSKFYERIGHGELVGTIAAPLSALASTRGDIVDFLKAHTGGPGC